MVPPIASPWTGSSFEGVGTISLLILFLHQTYGHAVRGVISRAAPCWKCGSRIQIPDFQSHALMQGVCVAGGRGRRGAGGHKNRAFL